MKEASPQTFKAEGMYVNLSGKDILFDQTNTPIKINYIGQEMDGDNSPTFEYQTQQGHILKEQIFPISDGFKVVLNFNNSSNTKVVLARGEGIEKVEKGVYKIGDVYVQINEKLKAEIVQIENESVLLVPSANVISYNLIW